MNKQELEKLSIKELKQIAKQYEIPGVYKYRKSKLIEVIFTFIQDSKKPTRKITGHQLSLFDQP